MTDLLGPGDAGAPRTLTTTTDVTNVVAGDTYFQDCSAGVPGTGTPYMAKWANRFLQQVRRIIRDAAIPLSNADDDMLGQALQTGSLNFIGSFGGTANALTATMSPAPPLLTVGMKIVGLVAATNTGPATLNVNALGNLAILSISGAALSGGELQIGRAVTLVYDGADFQIDRVTVTDVRGGAWISADDTGTTNTLAIAPSPAIAAYAKYQAWRVKVANNSTGPSTININGLGARSIVLSNGAALTGGEMRAGDIVTLVDDGSHLQLSQPFSGRIKLFANTTFFINSSTGSDSTGNGSAAAPWATLQRARNIVFWNYDAAGNNVTFNFNGAFTAGVVATNPILGVGTETWAGVSGSTVTATNSSCFIANGGAALTIQSVTGTLTMFASGTTASQGFGLYAFNSGSITQGAGCAFGSCAQAPFGVGTGGNITLQSSYTATGNGNAHFLFSSNGVINVVNAITCTLTSTPAYTNGFAVGNQNATLSAPSMTFSGTATGKKYNLVTNAVADTNTANINYFPGGTAGTTATGGEYG